MKKSCCICQCSLVPHLAKICSECQAEYDLDPEDVSSWPDWARFALRDERRKRYADEVRGDREIVFSDLDESTRDKIDAMFYGD